MIDFVRKCLCWTVLLFLWSCADTAPKGDLKIAVAPRQTRASTSGEVDLLSLDSAAKPDTRERLLVADVRLMISGDMAEARGNYKTAADLYFQALKIAQGAFGKEALTGWIRNYVRSLGQKTKGNFIARVLLDISQGGQSSPYMREKSITTTDALNPIVQSAAKDYLLPEDRALASAPFAPAPANFGIPPNDPLMLSTAAEFCKGKGDPGSQWDGWIASLSVPVKLYWESLLQECHNDFRRAAVGYEEAVPSLLKSEGTMQIAVEAARKMIAIWRHNAGRERAANGYLILMDAWQRADLTAAKTGLKFDEFTKRRIDDTLWAARYRAMVQDYEHARIFTDLALKLITRAIASKDFSDGKGQEALADFRAEAYLVLSNRIAVEEQNIGSASAQMVVALETPHLSREMNDRLLWYAGFYLYLDGQLRSGVAKWERLISETSDNDLKAGSFFWLAKAYQKLNNPEKVTEYSSLLAKKFPLSYYNVVASREAGFNTKSSWQLRFGNYDDLFDRLNEGSLRTEVITRASPSLKGLIKRAEILNHANLGKWGKLAVLGLDAPFKSAFAIKDNPGAYVYLARLHFIAENYFQSIGYTSALARGVDNFWERWPEQLLIYFPRPYDDVFTRSALETSMDKNLLYSVSRQESAFNPLAKSPANAYGLMQLILPTAEKFAEDAGFEKKGLLEQLFEPEVTISIGSYYLKSLQTHYKGYSPGVFGAYNAGEYAVDGWIARRRYADPLVWIEMVPYSETKDYIKNVWRNQQVYRYIERDVHAAYLTKQREKVNEANHEKYSR
jgi:soluble lytic murein transglycosylase-like protein